MFRISKLADYATVMMTCFARYPNQLLPAKFIAEETGLGEATVAKNLKVLTKHQLLHSQRGAAGGYSLARLPEDILLVEILQAIDGEMAMTSCSSQDDECQLEACCNIKLNWRRVNDSLMNALSKFSLMDMVGVPSQVHTVEVSSLTVRKKETVGVE